MRHGNNPYANAAANGIGQGATPINYRDIAFTYTYDQTLTANQRLRDQQAINNDSDFAWRALVLNSNTGAFSVRFSDSDWYNLSSDLVVSANLQADPASPSTVYPETIIPAGGIIGVELLDLSGAENTIQLLFLGVKRYALT